MTVIVTKLIQIVIQHSICINICFDTVYDNHDHE